MNVSLDPFAIAAILGALVLAIALIVVTLSLLARGRSSGGTNR